MWEDVAYYIECTYKKEEIETIFVMGDEAIRKIEKEIKEDEELGRRAKRLENRLKK